MPSTSPKQDTSAYPFFVCCVTEHRKKGVTHLPMRGTVESARPHSNEPANVCVCALLFICLLASSMAFLVAVFRRMFNFLLLLLLLFVSSWCTAFVLFFVPAPESDCKEGKGCRGCVSSLEKATSSFAFL